MPQRHSSATRAFAIGRVVMIVLILAALVLTLTDRSGLVPENYLHLVSYYTLQSNVVALVVWGAATAAAMGLIDSPRWLEAGRALVAANLLIVAGIYWSQIAPLGLEHGAPLQIVMVISHIVTPTFAALDQAWVGTREPVPWRTLPWLALHPMAWSASAIVNAWLGGWVPYEYLDPSRGLGAVTATVAAQGAALLALTMLTMRWRGWRRVTAPGYAGSFGRSPRSTEPDLSEASHRDFSRASNTLMTPHSPRSSM